MVGGMPDASAKADKAGGASARRELFGAGLAALVDEGDYEHVPLAQVVDDALGGGDLAQLRIVELGNLAPDVGRVGESIGFALDLLRDALGVLSRVLGDVVVDGFEIGTCRECPNHHPRITTARSRARAPRSRCRGRLRGERQMARIPDAELERIKGEVSLVREAQGRRLISQGKDLACRCPCH